MRNIVRVVLWGMPPSFCALVQRAGRAGRDFSVDAEAILIVSQTAITKGISEANVSNAVDAAAEHAEAANQDEEEEEEEEEQEEQVLLEAEGVAVGAGNELLAVDELGVRVSRDIGIEEAGADLEVAQSTSTTKTPRRRRVKKEINVREARYLSLFIAGLRCRREIWNEFFANRAKSESVIAS